MDFRDNCGIVYDPRIIETVKNVQVQFYPDFLRNTSFLLILDNAKSPILSGFFAYERKDFWQTQRIGTPAVSLRNKHSLRQIPLCIIAIFVTIEFGIEVDFDVELFIFLGDDDAVYQQPKISVADSSLLNDLLNQVNALF